MSSGRYLTKPTLRVCRTNLLLHMKEIITREGVEILTFDFSKCKTLDDQLDMLKVFKDGILECRGSPVLVLVDFISQNAHQKFVAEGKEVMKGVYSKLNQIVIAHVTKLQKVIINSINRMLKIEIVGVDDMEQGFNYLLNHVKKAVSM